MIKDKRKELILLLVLTVYAQGETNNILNFNEIVGYISHVIFILRKAT